VKLKMHDNSLFAVLLRSPWWVSVLLAVAAFLGMRLLIPDMYAVAGALPFFVIAMVAAWRQLRAPSAAKVAAQLDSLRAMSWEEFSRKLEESFQRQGYAVKRSSGAADFELEKMGRLSLVCARRWKASVSGVEPLENLVAAAGKREAGECVYVSAGELSGKAQAFAKEKRIRRLEGAELAQAFFS
jgi:restriction system protein